MSRTAVLVASVLVLLAPAPGYAVFHFAVINEVMSGVNGDSTIQYVDVRMLTAGQNQVCHSRLTVFRCRADGGGSQVLIDNLGGASATNPCLANGTAGGRWIMASPSAAAFLMKSGITPDFTWNNSTTGSIPTSCGMVCWGAPGGIAPPQNPPTWDATNPSNYVDCVAYGPYDGTAEPLGHAAATCTPGNGTFSLTKTASDTGMFDNSYALACPSPTNNAGMTGMFGACTPPAPPCTLPPTTTSTITTSTSTARPPTTSTTTSTSTTRVPPTTTTTTMPPVPCGDVNGDGVVNIGDALLVAQFDVGLRQCGIAPFSHPEVCDVNRDGACNIGDALRMAQCDVGLISCSFTCNPFACP